MIRMDTDSYIIIGQNTDCHPQNGACLQNVVKNNVSIHFVKIRIKMEYGSITLKTAKIRIGYG